MILRLSKVLDTGKVTYDPNDFTREGQSVAQSLWSTLHEIDHARELAQNAKSRKGKDLWEKRMEMTDEKRRYGVLDNCVMDVADNWRVLGFAPALKDEALRWYREEGWPRIDFTSKSRHMQFANAILREGMLPDEAVIVDDEVRQALDGLRAMKAKGREFDVIGMVTDPTLSLEKKLQLMERFVDPVFEALYEEDLENPKNNNQDGSGGGNGEGSGQGDGRQQSGGGESEGSDDQFTQESDEFDDQFGSKFDDEQLEDIAEAEVEMEEAGAADRFKEAYEKEHGVSFDDVQKYKKEYESIEQYLEPMREQFRRIVKDRQIPKRRVVSGKKDGFMVSPGLMDIAEAEFDRGNFDVPVYMQFEGRTRREEVPSAFEMSLVMDRSGSMSGGKAEEEQQFLPWKRCRSLWSSLR